MHIYTGQDAFANNPACIVASVWFTPFGPRSGIFAILTLLTSQAYFNGIHIPGLLSLKTLIAKLISATFVLAAGLIAEGEAPFVHIGAIVGGGLTSAGSRQASSSIKTEQHQAF